MAAEAYAVVDGIQFRTDSQGVELPTAGTHVVGLKHVPITTPTFVVGNAVQGIKTFERYAVVTTQPANVTIDWATLPVPRAVSVQASTTGATWSLTGAGTPDARTIMYASEWRDSNNVQRYAVYDILEPASATLATTLPALPAAYADDDPTLAVMPTVRGAAVFHFDYDNLADYAAAKSYGPELAGVEIALPNIAHQAHASYGATTGF